MLLTTSSKLAKPDQAKPRSYFNSFKPKTDFGDTKSEKSTKDEEEILSRMLRAKFYTVLHRENTAKTKDWWKWFRWSI